MTDPTHDALHTERLERLTELARRVYDRAATIEVRPYHWDDTAGYRLLVDGDAALRVGIHPRALDALEAALLVLAGDMSAADWKSVVGALGDRVRELAEPAWVEQLASEWEALAEKAEHHFDDSPSVNSVAALIKGAILTLGDAYKFCAQQLRERARQP